MSELKNCPFCGKEVELFPSHFEGQWCVHPPVIHCTACHQDYEGVGIAICDAMNDAKKEDFADNLLCNWWNRRPAEDAKDKEIERLKIHCNALYDCLFVLQKFFEHGASDTELSEKVQEANLTMVETFVKVLVTARKHGIDGTICAACKHRDCENCDLDVILKIQQTADAPDTNVGKMEEK